MKRPSELNSGHLTLSIFMAFRTETSPLAAASKIDNYLNCVNRESDREGNEDNRLANFKRVKPDLEKQIAELGMSHNVLQGASRMTSKATHSNPCTFLKKINQIVNGVKRIYSGIFQSTRTNWCIQMATPITFVPAFTQAINNQ
jgi:hypothetical protein